MLNNKGQSLIGILIVLVVVGIITGGLYYYFSKQIPEMPEITEKPAEEVTELEEIIEAPEEVIPEVIPPEKEPAFPPEPEKPVVQKCADGTSYGQCSINKPKYCDDGVLIDKTSLCGCPSGYKISDNQCVVVTPPKKDVEYWAVIFGTAPDVDAFNHLPLVLKDILIQHGWKEEHIKYFAGENATYANVITALDWLANNTGPNDIVLLHAMTHGLSHGLELSDRYLKFTELAEKLDEMRYSGMAIMIDACYSGSAIPFLKKENRVIMTSARPDEKAIAPMFSQYILAVLQGLGDLKGNNNGWVSAQEAFNFIQPKYSSPQLQIQDDYPGELELVFLNEYWRNLDQYNISGILNFPEINWIGLSSPSRLYGQSFKPDYPVLTKIMIGVYFEGDKPPPLNVSVRENLTGPDLISTSLDPDVIYPFSVQLYEFNFPDIKVTPNETYYLVISIPHTVEKEDVLGVWIDNQGGYPKGEMRWRDLPDPWGAWSAWDLQFATFGKSK